MYFGIKLLRDSYEMSGDGPSDELQEVEEELEKKKGEGNEADDDDIEQQQKKKQNETLFCRMGVESLKIFTQVHSFLNHFLNMV